MSAPEVYGILAAYGIPVAAWQMADNADDAERTAVQIGFPVVIKADSASIVHKSDMGGVAVNLENGAAVLEGTGEEVLSNPDVRSAYFGI